MSIERGKNISIELKTDQAPYRIHGKFECEAYLSNEPFIVVIPTVGEDTGNKVWIHAESVRMVSELAPM